jgi:hypothetical protein
MTRLHVTLLPLCAAFGATIGFTHEIDDGLEFGASLTVTSSSPVQAILTLIPTVGFKSVLVELPNAVGGPQTACRFGALVPHQRYTCAVSASVADDDSGLVIALSGVRAMALPGHDDLAFKGLTVPNPRFDARKHALNIDAATAARARLNSARGIPTK